MCIAFLNIFWPHFLGGCSITRDTEKFLKGVGKWTKSDLKQPETEPPYRIIPHITGVLEK